MVIMYWRTRNCLLLFLLNGIRQFYLAEIRANWLHKVSNCHCNTKQCNKNSTAAWFNTKIYQQILKYTTWINNTSYNTKRHRYKLQKGKKAKNDDDKVPLTRQLQQIHQIFVEPEAWVCLAQYYHHQTHSRFQFRPVNKTVLCWNSSQQVISRLKYSNK